MNLNELVSELRTMANRWALKARDYVRDARENSDPEQAQYYRGYADGYYKAATELAALLKGDIGNGDTGTQIPVAPRPAPPTQTSIPAAPKPVAPKAAPAAAPTPAPAATVEYVALPVGEVLNMLEYGGVSPRDVTLKSGNIVYAIFSRWQPFTEHERVAKVAGLDMRIVILNFGKLKDTGDPYIEFAFKQG